MIGRKKQKSGNAAVAGITGAVIGAGVAVAATRALSDKKTREKVLSTVTDVKDQVVETVNKVKHDVEGAQSKMMKKAPAQKRTSAKKIRVVKKTK